MVHWLSVPAVLAVTSTFVSAQIFPTGPNGPTNPAQPSLNTPVNQESMSRLLSLNSVDDFCIFGNPGGQYAGEEIGNIEAVVVPYCVKARNNARVIPDGTLLAAHFVKTPAYVQVQGFGDFTQIGIKDGDYGGELDPHGATNLGNPIGANVTSNVSGTDVFYQEWMQYVSFEQFCFRVCIAEPKFPTALMCEHELDVMGCAFVMPGNYERTGFDSCDADAAEPPGLYPQPDGSYSTFRQLFSGVYTQNGVAISYTVGNSVTPSAPFSVPHSSNCVTYSSIGNGIASLANSTGSAAANSGSISGAQNSSAVSTGTGSSRGSGSSSVPTRTGTGGSQSTGSTGGSATNTRSTTSNGAMAFGSLSSMAAYLSYSIAIIGAAVLLI